MDVLGGDGGADDVHALEHRALAEPLAAQALFALGYMHSHAAMHGGDAYDDVGEGHVRRLERDAAALPRRRHHRRPGAAPKMQIL